MPVDMFCPRCGNKIESNSRNCPSCGIDLAIAATLLKEEALVSTRISQPDTPLAPEILVPRLGDILIEKRLISPDDLERALVYHKELTDRHCPQLLGHILLTWGLIDRETLDQVITEQILQLQAALQQANNILEKRVQERTLDLQMALDKLSELNQLKSNFISNISHELRTPLTHIKGYLDLMADQSLGPLSPAQLNALDVMMRSELRLEQLIEDLIRFSLAVRGQLTLQLSPISLAEVIHSCVSRVSKVVLMQKKSVEVNVPEHLPAVKADSEKIAWVISQLLDNAIKFTSPGGKVRINVEEELRFEKFIISDTGIGIPKERLDEIFEPFHQLDGSETRRYGGTGLGLALVRRIIEAHGSSMKVQSEVGRGSCFEFSLLKVKDGNP